MRHTASLSCALAMALSASSVHAWTVRDSISIEQLGALETGETGPPFLYSPHRDLVAFVVRRSVVGTMRSQATLYVYQVAALERFAAQPGTSKPAPFFTASAETTDSQPAIRFVQWTTDGELLYVARDGASTAVFSWRAGARPVREAGFQSEVERIMPLAGNRRLLIETAIDQPAVDQDIPRLANGHTLEAVEGIDHFTNNLGRPSRLSVLDRENHVVRRYEATVLGTYGLWPSPDGRHVAALAPFAAKIEQSCWRRTSTYQPNLFVEQSGFDQSAYILLDLETGKSILPFAAPSGYVAPGFQALSGLEDDRDFAGFVWSADSKTAVAQFGLDQDSRCGGPGSPLIPAAYAIDITSLKTSKLMTFPVKAPDEPNHFYRIAAGVNSDGTVAHVAAYYGFFGVAQAVGGTFRRVGETWKPDGDWIAPIPKPQPLPPTLSFDQDLTMPPTINVADAQGHRRQLMQLVPPDAPIGEAKVMPFNWKDNDGHDWNGVLAVPAAKAAGPLPLIIQTHGYSKNKFYSNGAEAMTCFPGRAAVARGFAVLTVDEGPSLKHVIADAPEEGAFVAGGYAGAVRALTDQGIVDPARVAGIGWSRTGWWIEETVNHYPTLFKSAVVCDNVDYGYLQYLAYAGKSPYAKESADAKYGGSPWQAPQKWLSSATPYILAKARVPIRFESDSGLGYALYEWEGFQALRLNHVPSELWTYPSGTHMLVRPKDIETSQQGTLDWIDYWVNGRLTVDPADPDRAERWSDMRREMQIPLQPPLAAGQRATSEKKE